MQLIISGSDPIELKYLLLDFNGTIAFDGQILPGVSSFLEEISKRLDIFVLTADTFGTALAQCLSLPVTLHCLKSEDHTDEKGAFVNQLGSEHVVAMGNGQNDVEMLKNSKIGIGIFGKEGCATSILKVADLIVPDICLGLELLIYQKRLIATLRK